MTAKLPETPQNTDVVLVKIMVRLVTLNGTRHIIRGTQKKNITLTTYHVENRIRDALFADSQWAAVTEECRPTTRRDFIRGKLS